MATTVSESKTVLTTLQAREVLAKASPQEFKQHWNKGREEFHLKVNGHTDYIIAKSPVPTASAMHTVRITSFGRETVLSVRFGSPLDAALRETFKAIALLRATQRESVIEAIKSGAVLEQIEDRQSYALNSSRKGVLFSSRLPDGGDGSVLVRGDLTRDMSSPDKKLLLEVTWRSSIGTGGPLAFVVGRKFERLLEATR